MIESRLVWPVEALLGEGPMWLVRERVLWFVDIKRGMMHRLDPETGARASVAVGGRPSFIVPTSDGALLVGSGDNLHPFDGTVLGTPVARIDMPAHNRTNDATVDAAGRLWFGTMDDEETQPTGAIYLFGGTGPHRAGGDCIITNGPAVSPDGRFLYAVDTLGGTIWRHDISAGTDLHAGTLFVRISSEDGAPDGVTIDSEGCLWVALWGGSQVCRYAPDGTLLLRVAIPCAQVTKVAFGGDDLRTAYVTTARIGLTPDDLARQPLAGGLFAFDAPAPGLPLPEIRLS